MMPNMLASEKRIRGVEMCTVVSGRMMSLFRASSPKILNHGIVVRKMLVLDVYNVYLFIIT
jgi:hypothetical protein